MRLITNLTRAWLTRTTKPFTFKNEYDEKLPYADCEQLGLYVHIPFCKKICPFCPYCKSAKLVFVEDFLRQIFVKPCT